LRERRCGALEEVLAGHGAAEMGHGGTGVCWPYGGGGNPAGSGSPAGTASTTAAQAEVGGGASARARRGTNKMSEPLDRSPARSVHRSIFLDVTSH
jgi:hypothetical protein